MALQSFSNNFGDLLVLDVTYAMVNRLPGRNYLIGLGRLRHPGVSGVQRRSADPDYIITAIVNWHSRPIHVIIQLALSKEYIKLLTHLSN